MRDTANSPLGEPGRDERSEVLAALRHRRLHRRAALNRIPSYLVVGPPGMGKSGIIRHSGLRVDRPLELSSSSWWIGEEILFVEVSTQKAEPGEEHAALHLLRALRSTVPVSGVILVVSPADLTLADADERSDMSAALVALLRAFEARFRYAPPLYIVISKLDLTPGFAEFFDRLEPAEREQPWGFTLPVDAGRAAKRQGARGPREVEPGSVEAAYRAGFRHLLDAIRARVTQWITPETDPVQNARIAGFGAQVAALDSILRPIVEPLLPAEDRRWPGGWLRGLYLTSTQQDALSIDVLLPDMAKRFGLPRTGTLPPDLGRDDEALNFFVAGVFRRVILPEAGLALESHLGLRSSASRNWVLAAASVAACAALGFLFASEYGTGLARIGSAGDAVASVGPSLSTGDPGQIGRVLPALDAFAALEAAGSSTDPRLVFPLDRYAGALISRAAERLYDQALTTSLVPQLDNRLERDLVDLGAPSETIRSALAALSVGRDDASGAYRRWLAGSAASLPTDARADLERHGAQALRIGATAKPGAAYTAAARGILESRDGAPR